MISEWDVFVQAVLGAWLLPMREELTLFAMHYF